MRFSPLRWLGPTLRFVLLCACCAPALAADPSVAFYYGANPPLADLQAFDIAVVEPAFVANPGAHARAAKDGSHTLFAYVSLGEVQPTRPYYARLPAGSLRVDNPAWGSKVIDQAASGWSEFFLDQIIAPLWQQGWRGFFLDTLDSYQLFSKTDAERAVQTAAMVKTLRELKRRYPEARLMLNRGFELLPEIAPITYALAAESLFEGYDAGKNQYRPVPEADRAWLLGQMKIAHERYRLPVIAIDYVAPTRPDARVLARTTAKRIAELGFIPWVADGGLVSIGVGVVEVAPRTVLVIVDTANRIDLHVTEAQRYLGVHLNYLGLRYEFIDLANTPLPSTPLIGRYAGVVTWLEGRVNNPALGVWLTARMAEGTRVAIFDSFGFPLTPALTNAMGLATFKAGRADRLTIQSSDKEMMGFEGQPYPNRDNILPLRLQPNHGRALLQLADNHANTYDVAALTPWGGYVLAPFALSKSPLAEYATWVVHPHKFLRAALALPDLPVPDVTTEAGRRMLMAHIDGDGFASRAEMAGTPFSGEVVRKELLETYRLPTTVSVIEAEVAPQGLYPKLSPQLENIARGIFALPYVEGASHSYSHPFNWAAAMRGGPGKNTLPLPGYRFDLTREVKGSMDYINSRLMPKGKISSVFLWSGDSVPPPSAIEETYRYGYLNMNGGESSVNPNSTSWSTLAANGIRKGGWYQVFAPNQNENVYTDGWTGRYYGYENVIGSYKLAETQARFKAVDIYYHFYSGTKQASVAALHKIYRWAAAQPFAHVYGSQYIRTVIDFENTSIARDLRTAELVVRTGSALRSLRLPPGATPPSLSASQGLAGVSPGPAGEYLTMTSAEVRLSGAAGTRLPLHVHEASGAISEFSRTANGLRFTLSGNGRAGFSLAQGQDCTVQADGRTIAGGAFGSILQPGSSDRSIRQYDLGMPVKSDSISASQKIVVQCRA
jgi:hypothetical protein